MKIHVTGNAGAGKTTLAKALGKKLNLPVFHLDQIVWQRYWVKTPPNLRKKLEQELLKNKTWVIEGVSQNIRADADLIIYLDVPRYKCVWRCLIRNLPYLFKSRPELPDNCPEILILPTLLSIIWRFPSLIGPSLLQEFENSNNMVIVRNADEMNQLLTQKLSTLSI